MGACSVVADAAGGRVRGRVGGKYNCAHSAERVFGVGGVRAFFHHYGRHFAVQRNRGWDGKL